MITYVLRIINELFSAGFYRGFSMLAMKLISIDLWILLKARQFMNIVVQLLNSLFRVMFVMALGAGMNDYLTDKIPSLFSFICHHSKNNTKRINIHSL